MLCDAMGLRLRELVLRIGRCLVLGRNEKPNQKAAPLLKKSLLPRKGVSCTLSLVP